MQVDDRSPPSPAEVARVLWIYPRRWIVPVVLSTVAAVAFAGLHRGAWEASLALILRSEAFASVEGGGKFRTVDEMKAKQETILEIAKSASVLTKVLGDVGPPAGYAQPNRWPTPQDVEDFKSLIKLVPPKGAEFGKTEIFYLKVQDQDRARSVALALAICTQVQARFQQLLEDKAHSMMGELEQSLEVTHTDIQQATARLAACEQQVGTDLGELRMLQGSPSGESELRRRVVEVEHELRDAKTNKRVADELLDLLVSAQADPGRLLATPNRLLESQPALKRLKDGLVDSQLRTAQLLGTMSEAHPLVRAARASEQEVSRHIENELAIAIRGLQMDVRLTAAKVTQLEQQLAQVHTRLDKLASLRAEYANLVADVEHRNKLYEQAKRNLAEARATLAGALSTSLLDRVDLPDTGSRPAGPGKALVVLGGLAGGLVLGAGVLFLTVPSIPRHGDDFDEVDLGTLAWTGATAAAGLSHGAVRGPAGWQAAATP